MGALDGRVVLVTGASRRIAIGAAIARRAVADGAKVFVHSWSPADAEQPWGADPGGPQALVEELARAGGDVAHLSMDLADPGAPARLVDAAVERFGRLDAVVANHARGVDQDLEHLTADEVDLTFAVNVRASLLLAPRGITVNCVNPGPNDTGYADEELRAAVIAANPGGRWSTPGDTARLVAWLISDEAAWVTGQTIASDGGWSAAGR